MPLIFMLALVSAGSHTPAAAEVAKPQLICREDESVTGTHVRAGRRCKSATEWEAEDARRDRIPTTLRVTEGQNDGHVSARPH
jgi:hypothetical protein